MLGVGKTTFARRCLRQYKGGFADGGYFVDLTNAKTLADLVNTVSTALDVSMMSSGPMMGVSEHMGTIIAGLGEVLIVLDNFEQLVELGPESVGLWSRMAPKAVMMVTSRESLRLPGECVLTLGALSASDGQALFLHRARSAGARWASSQVNIDAIHQIVNALDGLPLAIELAAARSAALPPTILLERLNEDLTVLKDRRRGVHPRQATVDGMVAWSWTLLEDHEQKALIQLGVFPNSFDFSAAHRVLSADLPDTVDVIDVLESLIEKSLLQSIETDGYARFRLFVTVKAYAETQSIGSTHVTTARTCSAQKRFIAHFAEFAERTDMSEMWRELDNLCAATEYGIQRGDAVRAFQTGMQAARITAQRGPARRGVALLALLDSTIDPHSVEACQAAYWRGILQMHLGHIDVAARDFERALQLSKKLKAVSLKGDILVALSDMHRHNGQYERAVRALNDALKARRADRDPSGEAHVHLRLGALDRDWGVKGLGRQSVMTALHKFSLMSQLAQSIQARIELGLADVEDQNWDGARTHLGVGLSLAQQENFDLLRIELLGYLGLIDSNQGHFARARKPLSEAVASCSEYAPARASTFGGHLARVEGALGEFERGRRSLEQARLHAQGSPLAMCILNAQSALFNIDQGNRESALVDLEFAKDIAKQLRLQPESSAGKLIIEVEKNIQQRAVEALTIWVDESVNTFTLGEGESIHLRRRKALLRLFQHLIHMRRQHPGVGVTPEALLEVGWPGEVMAEESARSRIYTAISSLRSLGLDAVLNRGPNGYFLDPTCAVKTLT